MCIVCHDAIYLGMISTIKTTRHKKKETRKERNERRLKKHNGRQTEFALV